MDSVSSHMRERGDPALPRLVVAAGCFAGAAALALPHGLFAAAAALLVLGHRGGVSLLPFLLAGQVAGAAWRAARGGSDAPRSIVAHARVVAPTRATAAGRQSSLVAFEEAVDRAVAGTTTALLIEPGGRPLRTRGERLRIEGKLLPAGPPRNPGGFRERARLLADAVAPCVDAGRGLPGALRAFRRAIDRLGNAIEARLNVRLPRHAAVLADALVLGRAEALDAGTRDGLKAIGAWHFLAVSGSHVALVAAFATALLGRLRVPERFRFAATVPVVLFYSWLSGGEAPALRAAIGCLGAALVLDGARLPSTPSWLAAALLVLIGCDPAVATEAGFELSFVAVLALAAAARHGAVRSPKGTGSGIDLKAPLLRAARFALAAAIATAPLTAWHFGNVAWLAPLSTLLLGPLVAAALGLGLVAVMTTALPACCTLPFGPPLVLCELLLSAAARGGDRLPATPLLVAPPPLLALLFLVATWFALLARRPAIAAALSIAALVVVVREHHVDPSFTLLAAGHGQAALLRDRGRCDLFDAGSDGELTAGSLLAALRALGVERLDGLFLSHLDADHASLAPAILGEFDVGTLYLSEPARRELDLGSTPLLAELKSAAAVRGVAIAPLVAGDRAGSHECLWPPPGRSFAARNDGSLVLRVRAGGRTILLPADLEGFPLLELAARLDGGADLMLLPHHGNADPGLSALLARARPELALISRDDRALPTETVTALRDAGVPWLSTGRGAAIGVSLARREGTVELARAGACR